MTERTYRQQLRGTYHQVLTEIARHIGDMPADARPTPEQLQALKDLYRVKFHHGRSTESLTDEEMSDLINEVESDAASKGGVSFPARRTSNTAARAARAGARP